MSDFDFIVNNGIVVGNNTKIHGNTVRIKDLVSMSYASNLQISEQDTVIDACSIEVTRSAKYQLEVISSTDIQISELLLIQDGSASYLTEYGVLSTGIFPIVNFSTSINGSEMLLMARMDSGTAKVWFSKTSMDTVQYEPPSDQLNIGDRAGALITDRNNQTIEMRAA